MYIQRKLNQIFKYFLRWSRVAPHCLENKCPVKGLEEGHSYEFRVIAENLHGQSEALMTTEPITAKWPGSILRLVSLNFILLNLISLSLSFFKKIHLV